MTTDIVIVGKGIAALVFAFLLKQKGIRYVILDRKAKVKPFELAETLPPTALPLLQQLGLLSLFETNSIRKTYGYHSLWGSDQVVDHNFYFQNPFKYGLKIDKKRILDQLEQLNPSPTIEYEHQLNLVSTKDGIAFTFRQNGLENKLHAKVVVDATGRNRAVLKLLHIPMIQHDATLAFSCHLPKKKHPRIKHDVFVESFKDGWGLVSGNGDLQNVVSIFTHSKSPIFNDVGQYENWKTILQDTQYLKHFLTEDSTIKVVGKLSNSSKPEQVAGQHWLAIGDAALAFDPLSSHGISNSIYTAMKAAASIANYFGSGNGRSIKQEVLDPVTSTGHEAWLIKQELKKTDWPLLPTDPFSDYNETLSDIFMAYLKSKDALYRSESRWNNEAYWMGLE